MAYQDAWIRGQTTGKGDRDCAGRYEAIRSVIQPYHRQITVWDLGANLGYFGSRLAHDYGTVSVMVEPRKELVEICQQNDQASTIALTHRISVRDLQELALCECPEVVLALNVLHHFDDWRGALEAVTRLGESLIIETAGRGDTGTVNYEASQLLLDAIEAMEPELIQESPSHVTPCVKRPMYLLTSNKKRIERGYVYGERVRARGAHPVRKHVIFSNRHSKAIGYLGGETRPWVPGMNLWNFLQLGGSYPSRDMIQDSVKRAMLWARPHGDIRPWNFILSGLCTTAIDGGHRNTVDDERGLEQTLAWIDNPKLAYV